MYWPGGSHTLDTGFCLDALDEALKSGKPEIFNTDQGVQFTSSAFTGKLEAEGIRISMGGRGRALDNVFVERLWRSVKYENIYICNYDDVVSLYKGLEGYFHFYNHERPHQELSHNVPKNRTTQLKAESWFQQVVKKVENPVPGSFLSTMNIWVYRFGGLRRGRKKERQSQMLCPPSSSCLGARVAPQCCPILRAGRRTA